MKVKPPFALVASIIVLAIGVIFIAIALWWSWKPSSPALQSPSAEPSRWVQIENPVAIPTQSSKITDRVDRQLVAEMADKTQIPPRVLEAYIGASIAVKEEYPDCGLGWNTLAGIGYVETAHGTVNGGYITSQGQANPAIVGIQLNGQGVSSIPDTDHGLYDSDDRFDRAVGPMQFIPSTWEKWAHDGNGDGRLDPQNIDDAALSAAFYLCDLGGDLSEPGNWIRALAGYNAPTWYANKVADAAESYAERAES